MSCPDWRALQAAREREPDVDPPGWAAAREHLSECRACRAAAVELDPVLLFAALPAPRVTPAEVAEMQRAVAALVRAERVAPRDSGPLGTGRRRRLAAKLARGAAAAAVVLLALGVEAGPRRPGPTAGDALAALPEAAADAFVPPALEELDRPQARIYQIPAEGLSVVMIVDASLDV